MFENPAVLALFIIVCAVVAYLNHKAHKRDRDRKPGS
jgi:hypothetical protein